VQTPHDRDDSRFVPLFHSELTNAFIVATVLQGNISAVDAGVAER
jgi:hypothetical protein